MMVAERIQQEVFLRANLRNGEIVQRVLLGRPPIVPIDFTSTVDRIDIQSEYAATRQETMLLDREIHMMFCEDCEMMMEHCRCSSNAVHSPLASGGWTLD